MRREAKGGSRRAGQLSRAGADTQRVLVQIAAGLEAMTERFRRRQEQYESACRAWCGGSEPVPVTKRGWPEDSLGGRFFASMHIEEAQSAPASGRPWRR